MELVREFGKDDLAKVYVLKIRGDSDSLIECVESLQPPTPRSEKWVLIVSTLLGCPVACRICDAGGEYKGRLTAEEILGQIHFMVKRRFNSLKVPTKKFKIQFARMGEPALNPDLIQVLQKLPKELDAPGLLPSLSSIAPFSSERFFEKLLEVKNSLYNEGRFQLQFSLHSTDPKIRKSLIPVKTMDFDWMAGYGAKFKGPGDQKITLNFAVAKDIPIEPDRLCEYFDPELFLIKLTPLNPTFNVEKSELSSGIDPYHPDSASLLVNSFEKAGYSVILSIGEVEENAIGSNCGQYATMVRNGSFALRDGYSSENYAL